MAKAKIAKRKGRVAKTKTGKSKIEMRLEKARREKKEKRRGGVKRRREEAKEALCEETCGMLPTELKHINITEDLLEKRFPTRNAMRLTFLGIGEKLRRKLVAKGNPEAIDFCCRCGKKDCLRFRGARSAKTKDWGVTIAQNIVHPNCKRGKLSNSETNYMTRDLASLIAHWSLTSQNISTSGIRQGTVGAHLSLFVSCGDNLSKSKVTRVAGD